MRSILISMLALLIIGLAPSCQPSPGLVPDEVAYRESIAQWKAERLERLKGEKGWLNLAGLYWLQEGVNTFGSGPGNDIRFPGKADLYCGMLRLDHDSVYLEVRDGVSIIHEGDPISAMCLKHDHEEGTVHLKQGDLAWYIIKRGDKFGIRLRDYNHPRLNELKEIPCYPVSLDHVVEATLRPFDEPRTMVVDTPLEGFTESYECPGELHFKIHGNKQVLYPFQSGKGFFLVFADETTGLETYGAGRFMYTAPDEEGRIILDFNKAYNPPCAFSPFATCPMPPAENFLSIPIEAGEKAVHLH